MAQTKTVVAQTTNAKATTTLQDNSPVVPLPDTPQGVMVMGPQVTFRFVQDYNQANSYDYYDVVNVDGTSYIAIQNVPANTPITDTDYWVRWNDPNAEFAQLQDTVETFDSRIAGNASAIASLETKVDNQDDALSNRIDTLSSTVNSKIDNQDDALSKRIDTLSSTVNSNKEKHIVIIGDSWSDPNMAGNGGISLWWQLVYTGNRKAHCYAKSGAGYVHTSGTPFPTQAQTAANDRTYDHSLVEKVIVFGGINDSSSNENLDTFFTNAVATFQTLKSAFPYATITAGFQWYPHTLNLAQQQYMNYLKMACGRVGVTYTQTAMLALLNYKPSDVFQDDMVHPNALGHQLLSTVMDSLGGSPTAMSGNPTYLGNSWFGNITGTSSNPPGVEVNVAKTPEGSFYINDGRVHFEISDLRLDITGASGASKLFVDIPLVDSIDIVWTNAANFIRPVNIYANCGANGRVLYQAYYMSGHVYLVITGMDGNFTADLPSITVSISADFAIS